MARDPFSGISIHGVYQRSWRTVARDLWREINEDDLFNGAAALGFYLTLSIFPALIFLLSLIPYLPIPNLQALVVDTLNQALPAETAGLVTDTVLGVVATKRGELVSFGAILTLWAASSGAYSLMEQLNFSYDVKEARSYVKGRAIALVLVIGFGLLTVSALALVVVGDWLQAWLAENVYWNNGLSIAYIAVRWGFVAFALSLSLSLVYYFGPNVKQEFRFVTPGTLVGVILLWAASLLFKLYVQNFGNYNATYGGIGAMIVLMLWLNILGVVVLLGSEINALLEHYSPTGKDPGERASNSNAA